MLTVEFGVRRLLGGRNESKWSILVSDVCSPGKSCSISCFSRILKSFILLSQLRSKRGLVIPSGTMISNGTSSWEAVSLT